MKYEVSILIMEEVRAMDAKSMSKLYSELTTMGNRVAYNKALIVAAYRLNNPKATRDEVAKALNISTGSVSDCTKAWKIWNNKKFAKCTPDDFSYSKLAIVGTDKGEIKPEFKNITGANLMKKSREALKSIASGKTTDAKDESNIISHNVIINGVEMVLAYESIDDNGKLKGATLTPVEK